MGCGPDNRDRENQYGGERHESGGARLVRPLEVQCCLAHAEPHRRAQHRALDPDDDRRQRGPQCEHRWQLTARRKTGRDRHHHARGVFDMLMPPAG